MERPSPLRDESVVFQSTYTSSSDSSFAGDSQFMSDIILGYKVLKGHLRAGNS